MNCKKDKKNKNSKGLDRMILEMDKIDNIYVQTLNQQIAKINLKFSFNSEASMKTEAKKKLN